MSPPLFFFVVIRQHLLPLTNYLGNGQYALVQPIASKFAERCICTTLTPSCLARLRTTETGFFSSLVVSSSRCLAVSWSRGLAVSLSLLLPLGPSYYLLCIRKKISAEQYCTTNLIIYYITIYYTLLWPCYD